MSIFIVLTICSLLILAYIFDITASKTKIPSVILLLLLGWVVRQVSNVMFLSIPDLTPILPILGTIGLILIVLEGSLELEINETKYLYIAKSSIIALVPMLIFSFGLAYAFYYFGNVSYKIALANAIPFAIISSAIAIPSAQNLNKTNKEFITYESSLSDIFGVLFFNFITLNKEITGQSVGSFLLELIIILIVTLIATLGLAFLLNKIKHHVKFIPIVISIIMIYEISKIFHLPALIFILLFGLFLGNINELKKIKYLYRLNPDSLINEVHKFKELTIEIAFLVRALFFLLFGYLIETSELLNTSSILWALGITFSIYCLRYIALKINKINIQPLVYLAPRGLITILLFLSIPVGQELFLANKSLIIQVIILTALFMMIGLMSHKKTIENNEIKLN